MQQARATLQKIVLDALRRAPREEVPLLAWPIVCGPQVAERTQALAFQDGTLRIAVPDTIWRGQLRDMAPEYVAKLNRISPTAIARIEFVIAEVQANSQR
jgi:predicted nucleic acid-binding Zn ribbon protein